jgi:phospholipid/cholesterol/gamma-HCH transport system substrate-binding protein
METRANYLMIGAFVLGALAFAFIFIFWITNFAGGGKRYLIVFNNSVAGLTSGSSVGFNGIKVGEVQSFALDPEDDRKVQVFISVRDETPVREDSVAKIQSMGLTGGSAIQISPGTPSAPLLVATDENPVPRIKAARGAGQGLFDAAPDALNSANAFIQTISDTMTNVDEFTTMLKNKDQEISQMISEFNKGAKTFSELGTKIDGNVDSLALEAKQGLQNFSAAMQEARRAAVTLNRILEKFEKSPTGFLLRGGEPPDPGPRGFGQNSPRRSR